MTLFKEKYRIESARLPGWDYSAEGYYYVTICTAHRIHYFGRVVDGDVLLTQAGEIVAEEWLKTPELRKNVELDEWTVMPNHMHGILVIAQRIPPANAAEPAKPSRLKANSLGSIIGQFKGVCTKRIWDGIEPEFDWQTRFWDRIIRDAAELERARAYIRNNPLKWDADRDNAAGLYM
jgi:REP element-mobilizing transposase RayT